MQIIFGDDYLEKGRDLDYLSVIREFGSIFYKFCRLQRQVYIDFENNITYKNPVYIEFEQTDDLTVYKTDHILKELKYYVPVMEYNFIDPKNRLIEAYDLNA